jgi:hypothetical protein
MTHPSFNKEKKKYHHVIYSEEESQCSSSMFIVSPGERLTPFPEDEVTKVLIS